MMTDGYRVCRVLAALLCMGSVAMGGGSAYAQSAASGDQLDLDTLDVDAAAETDGAVTEDTGSYATVKATIGKTARKLREIPQSVNVITRQRLDDQNLVTLDQALDQVTGVTVQMSSALENSYYIRGFEVDTIQVNGVPFQLNGGFFSAPDMSIYDRVEVLRGPAGLFNGAGQPGGTFNLVRKRPKGSFAFNMTGYAGSWNNFRGEADVTGPLNASGTLRARGIATYEDREYFYDVAESKKLLLFGSVEYDLGPNTLVTAGMSYQRVNMTPFYRGLPTYSDAQFLPLPRSTYLNPAFNRTQPRTFQQFAEIEHRFDEDWKVKISATHATENAWGRAASVTGAVNPVTGAGGILAGFEQKFEGEQYGVDGQLTGAFELFGQKQEFMLGGSLSRRHFVAANATQYAKNSTPVRVLEWDPYAWAFPGRPVDSIIDQDVDQEGVYGTVRLRPVGPLSIVLGGRMSWFVTKGTNVLTGAESKGGRKENGRFTPFAGVVFDIDPRWSIYASYADIFRSQSDLFTFEGDPLPPVHGSNYEIGVKGALFDEALNVSAALFRINETNRSQVDYLHPFPCAGSPTSTCHFTEGEVRSQGAEAEITGRLAPGLEISAGYTYNETKYRRDRTATNAPSSLQVQVYSSYTPRHIARIWANYRLPGALSAATAAIGVNAQSRTFVGTGAFALVQKGYTLVNGRLAYDISDNWTAAINVNNLFDKHYFRKLSGTTAGNYYGDPRNVMLTIRAAY